MNKLFEWEQYFISYTYIFMLSQSSEIVENPNESFKHAVSILLCL
jgi:hypothetical protein